MALAMPGDKPAEVAKDASKAVKEAFDKAMADYGTKQGEAVRF